MCAECEIIFSRIFMEVARMWVVRERGVLSLFVSSASEWRRNRNLSVMLVCAVYVDELITVHLSVMRVRMCVMGCYWRVELVVLAVRSSVHSMRCNRPASDVSHWACIV